MAAHVQTQASMRCRITLFTIKRIYSTSYIEQPIHIYRSSYIMYAHICIQALLYVYRHSYLHSYMYVGPSSYMSIDALLYMYIDTLICI